MQQTPSSNILKFTPIREEDAEYLYPLAKDPKVTQYLTWDATTKEDMAKFYVLETENFKKGESYSFCIHILSNDIPVGGGSIMRISNIHRSAEIGYWLGKQFWGKGYGAELVKSLLTFGFKNLDLHRIYGSVRTENIASVHILEKTGFRREGHSKQSFWKHGIFHDLYQYAILECELKL